MPKLCSWLVALSLVAHAVPALAAELPLDCTDESNKELPSCKSVKLAQLVQVPDDDASSLAPAGGGPVPDASNPRIANWSLMANTQLQSVQLSDLATSFGLGVGYRSRRTDTTLIIRKATDAKIEGNALAADFGHFILDPSAADVGASLRGMYFFNSGRRCDKDCKQSFPGVQAGVYVSLDVGHTRAKATLPDATTIDESLSAGSLVAGIVARVADNLTMGDVERPIALGVYAGAASHLIGGDIVAQQRKDIFGNDRALYWGVEGGLFFQLASAEVTMKVSQIWPNGAPIRGLTGFQLVPRVVFSLPFDIVQYEKPKEPAAKEAAVKETPEAPPTATAAPFPSAAPAPAAPAAPPVTAPPAGPAGNP